MPLPHSPVHGAIDRRPTRACPPAGIPGLDERTANPILTSEEPPT